MVSDELLEKNDEEILELAIQMAQAKAREEGIEIGSLVSHPLDEEIAYWLDRIEEGVATVRLPTDCEDNTTGKDIIKYFPVDELFDVRVIYNMAMEITMQPLEKIISKN